MNIMMIIIRYVHTVKNEVGFAEDIYTPGDAVGYKDQSKYVTELFRKCEHCNKVFIEELGEEPDYFY